MIETKLILGEEGRPEVTSLRERSYADFDAGGFDGCAIHVLVYLDGTPAATGRLYHDGERVTIDGVCTLPELRRRGLADLAIRLLLFKVSTSAAEKVYVCPPEYIAGIFPKFGFKECGRGLVLAIEELTFPRKCGGADNG